MQASIHVSREPAVQYLLRIGDTCLILAQRLAEWCGHAPILGGGHRADQHGARPGRPGAGGAHPRRPARGRARRRGARRGPARLPARRARLPQPARWSSCRAATSRSRCCATSRSPTFLKLLWSELRALDRCRARRHRRQGAEGGALPPASTPPTGWCASATAPTNRAARMKAALDSLWPYIAEMFESDDDRRAGRRLGPRPALVRPARRLARRVRRRARRGRPGAAGRAAVPQHRQVGPAQRAPGLHPGRDAAPAARLSGRRLVSASPAGSARAARAGLGGARPACSIRRCRWSRCAISASCATCVERDDGARGRRSRRPTPAARRPR